MRRVEPAYAQHGGTRPSCRDLAESRIEVRAPQPHRATKNPLRTTDLEEQPVDRRQVRIGAIATELLDEPEVASAEQSIDGERDLDELLERVPLRLRDPLLEVHPEVGRALGEDLVDA